MAGGSECVCVEESAGFGVIVAGLEVIQFGLGVVDVATVAQGVIPAHGGSLAAGGGQHITPGIVGVGDDPVAVRIHDGHHVTLQIGDVVVEDRLVVVDGDGFALGIVGEVHLDAVHRHLRQLTTQVHILVSSVAFDALGAQTVCVVGEASDGSAVGKSSLIMINIVYTIHVAVRKGFQYIFYRVGTRSLEP